MEKDMERDENRVLHKENSLGFKLGDFIGMFVGEINFSPRKDVGKVLRVSKTEWIVKKDKKSVSGGLFESFAV